MEHPADPDSDRAARYFDVAHLDRDLKSRSVRGGAVTMLAQGLKTLLQLGSTAVLARLLSPSDFGLVAMVLVVTGFVALFRDLGLVAATVQRSDITHGQVSTLFWLNVASGFALSLVTIALGPLVAWWYGEPQLESMTIALAGTFLVSGLSNQHRALLRRQMKFGALAMADVVPLALSLLVAVAAAWAGLGVWALILRAALYEVFAGVMLWAVCRWRPGWPRKDAGVGEMIRFGGNVTGSGVLYYVGTNFDQALIGWAAGPSALGLYAKAYGLMMLPLQQLNGPVSVVSLPALSRAASNPERYRRAFLGLTEQVSLVGGLMSVVLIASADVLIAMFLGDQWTESARLFAIFGYATLLLPTWNAVGWLFLSQGRGREHLRFSVVESISKIASVAAGLPWGVTGVAVAVALRYYVALPWLFFFAGREGPVSVSDLYRVLAFPMAVSFSSLAFVSVVRPLLPTWPHPLVQIGATVFLVGLPALALTAAFPRGRALLGAMRGTWTALSKRTANGT